MSTLSFPVFNTLKFANRLKAAGVPEKQAEAEAEALHEVFVEQTQPVSILGDRFAALEDNAKCNTEQMATKGDVAVLKTDVAVLKTDVALLKTDVAVLKTDVALLKTDVAVLKTDVALLKTDVAVLKTDVALVKADLSLVRKEIIISRRDTIIWLGSMLLLGFGTVISVLFKLIG